MPDDRDRLPLTASQTVVWLAQQADPENPIHAAAEYLDIQGPADLRLLQIALRQAVEDTDAFRVRFEIDADGPWQVVGQMRDWPLPVVDLRTALDPLPEALAQMEADLRRTTDLTRDLPFNFTVFVLADDRSLLYVRAHHIVMDGFGFGLFLQRVAEVYTALEQGQDCPPSGLGSLRELIEDDLRYRNSEQFARDHEYWMEQLSPLPAITTLAGKSAPTAHSFLRNSGQVPAPVVDQLRDLARRARCSLPTVAMAALALYLQRTTGAHDLVLELVVAGRKGPVARSVPGMVTNAPPLRIEMDPAMTTGELLRHTAARARGVMQHQRYPSCLLAHDLGIADAGIVTEPPAINIMGYTPNLHFGQHPVKLHNLSNGAVEDLTINVYDRSDGSLRIDFNANPSLYGAAENAEHHSNFMDLLHAFATADPEEPVAGLGLQPSSAATIFSCARA
ncbi:condensation domain-containing protein [Saccharopolyspora sp. NPDC050389]|uniref:condensation domain-containing protein n=1 Tax=Saccharopolyspora sp. NPDC050389 TaxID=3155516 RepID=UPI0033CFD23F